jgi:peptidoglycan/xylan/chitin deacetylase (PgdA/CDA1 family)
MTLDLEQDYGDILDIPRYEGFSQIAALVNLLRSRNIPLTCFVQGSIFYSHPFIIQQMQELNIEFELHGYYHLKPTKIEHEFEISKGIEAYTSYFNKTPLAYRSPSGIINNNMFGILSKYHLNIDSSIFPSLRPGGYFNGLNKPIMPYLLDNKLTVEFPISVCSKIIRIPITLSYLKLFGKSYFDILKLGKLPILINFDFHLHDLSLLTTYNDITFSQYNPIYQNIFRKIYLNNNGLKILENIIDLFFTKGYEFLTLSDVYNLIVVDA